MLELQDITFTIQTGDTPRDLIHRASLKVPSSHFMAIVGPSGCGKSTLLKLIAGILHETDGSIFWKGVNLAERDLEPSDLGYVPQFSIAFDHLTVGESVRNAALLRVRVPNHDVLDQLVEKVLSETGLTALNESRVKILSGGQKRRLALALELVSSPKLLLCDEVTSGLDPKSEAEIVRLLHNLSKSQQSFAPSSNEEDGTADPRPQHRIVINVTHSLGGLELYDSVLVMHEGKIVYHGPPRAITHYFNITHPEEIYPTLAKRSSDRWHDSWKKKHEAYYKAYGFFTEVLSPSDTSTEGDTSQEENEALPSSSSSQALNETEPAQWEYDFASPQNESLTQSGKNPAPKKITLSRERQRTSVAVLDSTVPQTENLDFESDSRAADEGDDTASVSSSTTKTQALEEEEDSEDRRVPGFFKQFIVLLARRWKIFFRDKTQLYLHLAMLIGFPILVAIFAMDGIDQVKALPQRRDANLLQDLKTVEENTRHLIQVGGLISGLIMFQVILLSLMGANNSAREIASERSILEKEKLGGLRTSSYVASKIVFLATLVLAQSLWMGAFVEMFCGDGLPGDVPTRFALLFMVTAALTAISLGISALMKTPEQATLLSIYLVGFQLPLSGAVLAMPKFLEPLVQPLIAAFWGWSGSLKVITETVYDRAITQVTNTQIVAPRAAFVILGVHILIGLSLAWIGTRRSQWEA